MLELSRTIRFCINGPAAAGRGDEAPPANNGFAGWPPMRGLGRYYELEVCCVGEADPKTGYFMNIKTIDAAVRDRVLPLLERAAAESAGTQSLPMGRLMCSMLEALQPELKNSVASIRLQLTPYHSLACRSHDMDHVIIRQRYEFSAAHRLNVPSMSEAENVAFFGKCNNPAGHGHNYEVEVAVRSPIDAGGRTLSVERLDAVVDEHAIEKLDHKHLNLDVPEFATLNPSVEHIAQVVWRMLEGPISAKLGVTLDEVRVWETGKTVCAYRGSGQPSGVSH